MKKILAFLLFLFTLGAVANAQALKDPYTNKQLCELLNKIFYNWLGDKSEKLVFVTADGQLFVFGGDPGGVSVETHAIVLALAGKGQSFKTVTNVVHPHGKKIWFNERDLVVYRIFKKLGFSGKFQIFYPEMGRIRTYKRD